jgi:enamine deaminase RidA (YjgF/YER057c/UK114 family)
VRCAVKARRAPASSAARLEGTLRKPPPRKAVGRAHGEAFGAIRPACSMVEVAKLIAPEILVEIEADAVLGAGRR